MGLQVLLRPVGYWTVRAGDGLPDPRALMSLLWERERRSLIAAYLGSAPVLDTVDEKPTCIICGAESGRGERTDGVWRWPESLAHYVAAHGVKLPNELMQHMERLEFTPPRVNVRHLRDQLAPNNPQSTSLISKASAAAALDDMLGAGSSRQRKPPPTIIVEEAATSLDDATTAIPVATRWTASVRGVPTRPQLITFDRPIVFGRDRTCDVVLEHSSVSRRHARMVPSEDRVIVQDLDSANGVWIDKTRCAGQIELRHGEEVRLGQATITLLR